MLTSFSYYRKSSNTSKPMSEILKEFEKDESCLEQLRFADYG